MANVAAPGSHSVPTTTCTVNVPWDFSFKVDSYNLISELSGGQTAANGTRMPFTYSQNVSPDDKHLNFRNPGTSWTGGWTGFVAVISPASKQITVDIYTKYIQTGPHCATCGGGNAVQRKVTCTGTYQ
jgi:hypothetical protein